MESEQRLGVQREPVAIMIGGRLARSEPSGFAPTIADKTVKRSALGALVLHACLLAYYAGAWHRLSLLAVGVVGITGFNVWLARLGGRAARLETLESVRLAGNLTYAALVGHLTDWSLPNWLLLPYMAVVTPDADRYGRIRIIAYCAGLSALAVLDGSTLTYPATFSALALACYLTASVKTEAISAMLDAANEQRRALVAARERLAEANATILADVAALKQAELELRQSQKLEAVGRLASGIAHEINTPIQFVGDSVHFLGQGLDSLLGLTKKYRALVALAGERGLAAAELDELRAAEEQADLEYLETNMPSAVACIRDGLARVGTIVSSMKEFAHPDRKEKATVDLNRAILATLTIARNEYKYVADLTTELGDLPPVRCFVGELNQVILNLVVNAAHAIGDKQRPHDEKGTICVRSRLDGDEVVLEVADSGGGIPDGIRERIFEPFFTTKEVGRGTGQGLAIARSVVERHGGRIAFETEVGRGTTFTIRIPIAPANPDEERKAIAA